MTEQKRFPWLAIILGVGCMSILCIGILLAGGVAFYWTKQPETVNVPKPIVTVVVVTPTMLTEPTQPGPQDGTFGVFCHFQDAENYCFVEIDLETNRYLIGQILDDETFPLTEQNADGYNWQSASALKSLPTSINHIGVSCYLDSIMFFVNNQLVDEVSVS